MSWVSFFLAVCMCGHTHTNALTLTHAVSRFSRTPDTHVNGDTIYLTHTHTRTHTHTHSHTRTHKGRVREPPKISKKADHEAPPTVPYEGSNFTSPKMDHFSLIFKTPLKFIGMFFISMLNRGIFKGKKCFLKLKQPCLEKHGHKVSPPTPIFKALCPAKDVQQRPRRPYRGAVKHRLENFRESLATPLRSYPYAPSF